MQRQTSFTYQVSDGEGGVSTTFTVSLTIDATVMGNSAPMAADDLFTIQEGEVLAGENVLLDNGNGPDTDPDPGDTLTVSVGSLPMLGTLDLNSTGAFTYTPRDDDVSGMDMFEYALSDGKSTTRGTVRITINPVFDPIVAQKIEQTVNELQGTVAINLLDNDLIENRDNLPLTITQVDLSLTSAVAGLEAPDFTVSDQGILSFEFGALAALDNDEQALLTFTYVISAGGTSTVNMAEITVLGLDNGIGRSAGQYANTISERYNFHFQSTNQAPASCHTCHNPTQVDADVDTVNDCTATVFRPYGLMLCRARREGQDPLADLPRRLREVEPQFAPLLTSAPTIEVNEVTPVGTDLGAPLSATAGRDADGNTSTVLGFGFTATLQEVDPTGQFSVDRTGQLRVRGRLRPGVYPLDVRPINDAKQLDNAGSPGPTCPAFSRS